MPFTMFTLAMLLICILCIGKEVFNGFVRGPLRALVSLCAVVFSVICSVFVSHLVGSIIVKIVMENVVSELIADNLEMLADFSSVYQTVSFFIQAITNVLVFVVLFPVFKWLINFSVDMIIKCNLRKIDDDAHTEEKQNKLRGAIVGGLCGMIVATAVTAPIMGTLQILDDTLILVENISENIPASEDVDLSGLEPIDEYASDPIGNVCYTLGGELIYKSLVMANFDGKYISAIDEIQYIKGAAESATGIAACFFENNDSTGFSRIADKFYTNFEKSQILRAIVLEVIPDFSSAWLSEEDFHGIEMPDSNDDFKPMINELLVIGLDINEYNMMSTVKSLVNMVSALIECDIKFDGSTNECNYYLLASKLLKAFENDPNMANVKYRLENVATVAIADLLADRLTDVQHMAMTTEIADDISQVLKDVSGSQARTRAVNEKLLEKFDEFGLSVDPSLCELLAYKLVKTAESNHDRISSFDIETLLSQDSEE